MDLIAHDIVTKQKNLLSIDANVKIVQKQINRLDQSSKSAQNELKNLLQQNTTLVKIKKNLEQKIVDIIAKKFSFYLIADKGYQENTQSIIAKESIKKLDMILKSDFEKLTKQYKDTNAIITKHNKKISSIQKSLSKLINKQNELKELKAKRAKNVTALKQKQQSYKKQLERTIRQKNELSNTLEKLKIIKRKEDEKRRQSIANAQKAKNYNKKLSVRQIGSSYLHGKVKSYKGAKTISPLDRFYVKEKFGNYVDPIYKIKIFNESVVLGSKIANAKVRNILNGKVIFAKDTSMLQKVIIVENRLGIHTIYANLSQIAPTIKVGKLIKKGYVIGRVKKDLTFEVTQKNYHINPLELIRN